MKNVVVLLLALLSVVPATAEDIVQVAPFKTTAGVSLDDYESFSVVMVNTAAYTALQFDMYLPEGMTLDPEFPMELSSDRFPGVTRRGVFYPNHEYDCTLMSDGRYNVTVYSSDLETISGNDGEIMTFYYSTSADMKDGYYPIVIKGTKMAIDSHNGAWPETSVSFVKIGNPPSNAVCDLGTGYYIPSFVQEELAKVGNVVVNGECENVILTDDMQLTMSETINAKNVTYTANVGSSLGYKTLVLPYDCDVPDGFEAYETQNVVGETVNLTQVSQITAHKPVILKNAGSAVMSAQNVSISLSSGELQCGVLVGTYEEISAPVGSYVLQNHNGNVAFYLVGSDVQPKVGAFRAYLMNDGGSNAKTLSINWDEPVTGIQKMNAVDDVVKQSRIYNMYGQSMDKLSRGINIVREGANYKKRLVK